MRLVVLTKAKYKRRWKGKDGKWKYDYSTPKQSSNPSDLVKLKAGEFDAMKLGWSMQDAKDHGTRLSTQHPGKYVTMTTDFGIVTYQVHNSLPASGYAPGDFKEGYAYNGKWKAWSAKRNVKYSNKMLGYGEGSDR